MEPYNPLSLLPDVAKYKIVMESDIDSLASLSQTGFGEFLSKSYVLDQLSLLHDLPFSESFGQFLGYSSMESEKLLFRSAGKGDIRVVRGILDKVKFDRLVYNMTMAYAAEEGHIEIVRLMLNLGANNYNWAMANAALGNYIEIVGLMLSLGDKWSLVIERRRGYNWAMTFGARGGHIKIVELMLSLGANNYEEAMANADEEGHTEIVQLLESYL